MTPTTPSPISDQAGAAIGEPDKRAEALTKWTREVEGNGIAIMSLMRSAYRDGWDDRAALDPTAQTTGSAPCVCGMPSDALSVHRQDGPCYRKEVSASPVANVPREDAILAIAIDHGLGTAVVESIVKALLAASMGGDRT